MKSRSVTVDRTPVFPPSAFFGMLTILTTSGYPAMFYPMNQLYTKNADFFRDAKEYRTDGGKKRESIGTTGIIVPLTFSHTIPLLASYWSRPSNHYDPIDRAKLFTSSILHPGMHCALVTPAGIHGETEEFSVAIPFFRSGHERAFEQFMLTSDFPVDESANAAAIYLFGDPVSVDLTTEEFIARTPLPAKIKPN